MRAALASCCGAHGYSALADGAAAGIIPRSPGRRPPLPRAVRRDPRERRKERRVASLAHDAVWGGLAPAAPALRGGPGGGASLLLKGEDVRRGRGIPPGGPLSDSLGERGAPRDTLAQASTTQREATRPVSTEQIRREAGRALHTGADSKGCWKCVCAKEPSETRVSRDHARTTRHDASESVTSCSRRASPRAAAPASAMTSIASCEKSAWESGTSKHEGRIRFPEITPTGTTLSPRDSRHGCADELLIVSIDLLWRASRSCTASLLHALPSPTTRTPSPAPPPPEPRSRARARRAGEGDPGGTAAPAEPPPLLELAGGWSAAGKSGTAMAQAPVDPDGGSPSADAASNADCG